MSLARVHGIVHGRVQGVYFRAATQQQARRLGLMGWVRNCGDGTVEFLAEGAGEKVLGEDRVLVHERALVDGHVFVVEDGVVRRVAVELAGTPSEDGRREVASGLRGGEEVVIDPPKGLADGTTVQTQPFDEDAAGGDG